MFANLLSTHILLCCFEGSANKTELLQTDQTEGEPVLDTGKMVQDEKFKYKCEVCGRRYMQEYSYQRHMQCHSGNHLIVSLDPNICIGMPADGKFLQIKLFFDSY